jgi:hypothetical protein
MNQTAYQLELAGLEDIELSPGLPECVFNDDQTHRFVLRRLWESSKAPCMFIGLNPSTADRFQNDRTVNKCMGYAESWGYGSLIMANLFSVRTPYPKVMKQSPQPNLAENNTWLFREAQRAGLIVAAWGNDGTYKKRDLEVLELLAPYDLYCLGVTQPGQPKHPMPRAALPADLKPTLYRGATMPRRKPWTST